MKISKECKDGIFLLAIIIAVVAIIFWICIHILPDNVVSSNDYAVIVGAGAEYEIKPTKSFETAKFNTINLESQYYIQIEVDGETYKLIGNDLYDAYKDHIGDSIEVIINTYYYPYVSKFKKVVTIPRTYSE